MKIALVHDDLIQQGGAEKLLLAMHEMWPEAPIYTSMATRDWSKLCQQEGIVLRTSFMQSLPFKKSLYKFYFWLFPLAFESFNFDEFDVVLSSSARFAHGIITKPTTLHICYMNTPGRMWWEPEIYFQNRPLVKFLLSPLLSYLRLWDYVAAKRVDYFIANSKTPQARIKKYFHRDSQIIYPFAEKREGEEGLEGKEGREDYYLVVTRVVAWKRVDIATQACKNMGAKLVIVGEGSKRGRVDDNTLRELYQNSRAVIITQEEDFGIVAVEAASFKKPVIAFRGGGNLETVIQGKTGEFFYPQTAEALQALLQKFDANSYKDFKPFEEIVERFSQERFSVELRNIVTKYYDLHHSKKDY